MHSESTQTDIISFFHSSIQTNKKVYSPVRKDGCSSLQWSGTEPVPEVVGVKGLNRCQQRWWKHDSPQRELEIQTSTKNTAPDTQMCPYFLTDGTRLKQRLAERAEQRTQRQKKEIREEKKKKSRLWLQEDFWPPWSCSCNQTIDQRNGSKRGMVGEGSI